MGQEGQRAGSGLARKTGNRGIFFRGWQREANGGEQLGGRGRGRWMSKEEIENQKRPSKYGHGGFLIHFPRGIVLHAFIWSFSSFSLVAWVFYCFCFPLLSSPGIHLGDKPGYRFMLCHRLGNLFIPKWNGFLCFVSLFVGLSCCKRSVWGRHLRLVRCSHPYLPTHSRNPHVPMSVTTPTSASPRR